MPLIGAPRTTFQSKFSVIFLAYLIVTLHTYKVVFSTLQMDELHQGLIAALNAQENTMLQKESINLVNQTEVYWFFQELNKFF